MIQTLALWSLGWQELLIILGIALLVFGRRLPEVGRSLGKGIVEFKKGLKGLEDEMSEADRDIDDELRRQKVERRQRELEADTDDEQVPHPDAQTHKGKADLHG
jgi:TatA/E family protein of Tat protein translocase